MTFEHTKFDGPYDIKEVILGIRKYACTARYENYPHAAINLVEEAKYRVQSQLADGLKKYFKVEVDERKCEVFASVHLPYITDEVVKELEGNVANLEYELRRYSKIIDKQRNKIEYLELPFWRKAWLKLISLIK